AASRVCERAASAGASRPAQRILHATHGVADFPADLVGLSFSFELLVAGCLAVQSLCPKNDDSADKVPPSGSHDSQTMAVTPIAIAAAAMTTVATQPTEHRPSWTGNLPITFWIG